MRRMALAAALTLMAPALSAFASSPSVSVTSFQTVTHSVGAGAFTRIYDPSIGEAQPWYINDHTIVRGDDGTWHLFGITHQEPADPEHEINFAHATAPSLHGPWTKQPFALTVDPSYGETHLWAPYVLKANGRWYMFYAAGGTDHTQSEISVATSTDLWHWTRYRGDPMFRDGFDARDPFVMRVGGRWVMYYDATSDPAGGNHVVAYRTSTDLMHWSDRHIAFTDPSTGTFGGPTESPYIVRHNGAYYLFIGPRGGYVGTDVFVSHDPLHFDGAAQVGHIASHALEVVQDTDSSWWVTSAGWAQGGVYLAPLDWSQETVVSGLHVSAPSYRLTVQTAPEAAITSLSAPVDGRWRELLDNSFRGTVPYLGVGGFGATDRPGSPTALSFTNEAANLTDIPMGRQPVTVDWSFQFGVQSFDMTLGWNVTAPLTAPTWEAAWSLDTNLTRVGDPDGLGRSGDAPGFPNWTLASDDTQSLIAAYKRGSAWAEANHWFDPPDGALSWQPLWAPGGTTWQPGSYAGGTWRIAVSPHPDDTTYATDLYTAINS
jgi:hypothetical protein